MAAINLAFCPDSVIRNVARFLAASTIVTLRPRSTQPPVMRPVAQWHRGGDGRLFCAWQLDSLRSAGTDISLI
jgi:hypothetical protein